MMDITLIRPPVYSKGLMGAQLVPVLGIAYIAAAARKAGHDVDVVDMCGEDIDRREPAGMSCVACGMPIDTLKKRLKPSKVFGFTCMFSQDWAFHRQIIRYVRQLYPESILVAGGEHASALPEFCMEDCPELDICVVGEGEEVFTTLIRTIEEKREFSAVSGIVYRSAGTCHVRTPAASRIRNIDALPLPAWDMIPMENYLSRGLTYHIKRGRTIPMLATRGCPHGCTFCSNARMWGALWVPRSPGSIVDEMEHNIRRYKADNFVFSDLTAVVDRTHIIDVSHEIIRRKMPITWQVPTLRTEPVDRAVLKLMYNSGCRELDFAIESGSKRVLASVRKNSDPARIASLIRDGLVFGMNFSANFIVGLPGEDFRDLFKTYALVIRLAIAGMQEVNIFPFIPYPGSELFERIRRENNIMLNDDYFIGLFAYSNIGHIGLGASPFTKMGVGFSRFFLLMTFYGIMFLARPGRFLKFIWNMLRGRSATKLEGVLRRVLANMRYYFLISKSRTEFKETG